MVETYVVKHSGGYVPVCAYTGRDESQRETPRNEQEMAAETVGGRMRPTQGAGPNQQWRNHGGVVQLGPEAKSSRYASAEQEPAVGGSVAVERHKQEVHGSEM